MVCNFNFRLYLESSEALERTEGKGRRIRETVIQGTGRAVKAIKSRDLLETCLRMIRSQYAGMGKGKDQVAFSEVRG